MCVHLQRIASAVENLDDILKTCVEYVDKVLVRIRFARLFFLFFYLFFFFLGLIFLLLVSAYHCLHLLYTYTRACSYRCFAHTNRTDGRDHPILFSCTLTQPQKKEIVGDEKIGRFLMDTISLVPQLDSAEFEKMFNSSLQDLLMVTYLASLVKANVNLQEASKAM